MGNAVVVDTNVVSYQFISHPFAKYYAEFLHGKTQAISFISLGELVFGASRANWGPERKLRLDTFIGAYTVLQSNVDVCQHYGWTAGSLRRTGKPVASNDIWIAATALAYNKPLVSHNRRHFEHIPGLELVSFAP